MLFSATPSLNNITYEMMSCSVEIEQPPKTARFSVTELSSHFSTYSLDGQSKQDQAYSFDGPTEQPIFFTQPNYSSYTTSGAFNLASDPPSPTTCDGLSLERTPPRASSPQYPTHFSTYSSTSSMRLRQQRQRAVRSQCSESHLRDISALLARMVAEGEQCSVYENKVPSLSRSSSDELSEQRAAEEGSPTLNLTSRIVEEPAETSEDEEDTVIGKVTSLKRGASSSSSNGRQLRPGTGRSSFADLRAQASVRDGISKNMLRSRRPTFGSSTVSNGSSIARRRACS